MLRSLIDNKVNTINSLDELETSQQITPVVRSGGDYLFRNILTVSPGPLRTLVIYASF
jgi:hypothetical protein